VGSKVWNIIPGPKRAGPRTVKFDRNILFARKRLRASAWLSLLSVALVQLSLASHQFDHAATELVDSCETCVQLERLDDAATGDAASDVLIAVAYGVEAHPANDVATPSPIEAYRPRDPPIS
jgi:hypothetical protein